VPIRLPVVVRQANSPGVLSWGAGQVGEGLVISSGLLGLGPTKGRLVVLAPLFRRAGEGEDVGDPPGCVGIPAGQHRACAATDRNRDSGGGQVARDGEVNGVPVSGHGGVVGDEPAASPPGHPPPVMAPGRADVGRVTVREVSPLVRAADLIDACAVVRIGGPAAG